MCGGTQTISYVFSVANPDSTKFVKMGNTVCDFEKILYFEIDSDR